MGTRIFLVMSGDRTRQWAQTETEDVLSQHWERVFYCAGDGALALVAMGACGVSILRDTQKLSGQGPG